MRSFSVILTRRVCALILAPGAERRGLHVEGNLSCQLTPELSSRLFARLLVQALYSDLPTCKEEKFRDISLGRTVHKFPSNTTCSAPHYLCTSQPRTKHAIKPQYTLLAQLRHPVESAVRDSKQEKAIHILNSIQKAL